MEAIRTRSKTSDVVPVGRLDSRTRTSSPVSVPQPEQGFASRIRIPFLRSRKKSHSVLSTASSFTSTSRALSPLPPAASCAIIVSPRVSQHSPYGAESMSMCSTSSHLGHSGPVQTWTLRDLPYTASPLVGSTESSSPRSAARGHANRIYSNDNLDSFSVQQPGENVFATPRKALHPPPNTPQASHGATFSPLLLSPTPTHDTISTPMSRIHFPYPPKYGAGPDTTSQQSSCNGFLPIPETQYGKNARRFSASTSKLPIRPASLPLLAQVEAQEPKPELNRRPSRSRLNWADSLPLTPITNLVAPQTPSRRSLYFTPSSDKANSVKSPTSSSVRSRISALIDEPPSAPPNVPLPPAPTSFLSPSMNSLPSIPSLGSTPSPGVSGVRQQADSFPGSIKYPNLAINGQPSRRSSKEELLDEVRSHGARFDELATYLQRILASHESAKESLDKRLQILEAGGQRRDEEIRSLRWLILSSNPAVTAPSLTSNDSPTLPLRVQPQRDEQQSGLDICQQRAGQRLARPRSVPNDLFLFRSLSLNTLTCATGTEHGIEVPPTSPVLPNHLSSMPSLSPVATSSTLSVINESPPSEPSLSQESGEPSSRRQSHDLPTRRSHESKLRKSRDTPEMKEDKKRMKKLQQLLLASSSSSSDSIASRAYARNLDVGRAPNIDELFVPSVKSPRF